MIIQHGITIREVADDVGILFSSCQAFFMDVLDIKRATAKIVLKLLNFEQKQCRLNIAQKMLTTFNYDPDLLKKVITCDKSKQSPIIPIVQKSQDQRKHVKFGQM